MDIRKYGTARFHQASKCVDFFCFSTEKCDSAIQPSQQTVTASRDFISALWAGALGGVGFTVWTRLMSGATTGGNHGRRIKRGPADAIKNPIPRKVFATSVSNMIPFIILADLRVM